jgi:Outer membrane protein beta-barrel domain
MKESLTTVLLCIGLMLDASGLPAQYKSGQWGAGVRIGASPYDLDGTGTGIVLGTQADLAVNKVFLAELSVALFDHSSDVAFAGVEASERTRLLFPEFSLQAQTTLGRFQPYLLAGGGAAVRLNGFVDGGATLHAGLGTRIAVGQHTLLRFEVRARSVRPWAGETVDLTAGIEWTKR